MNCVKKFAETYKKEPMGVAFCPYRVCPLGAHVDHQGGKVMGLAIDKGIHIAYSPKYNGVIELSSLQFEKRAQWYISAVPKIKENDWADYLRGATLMLSRKYILNVGLSGVIEGSLPIGGLSSSAAVIIAFLAALCKVNNIVLEERELISIAQAAENQYVGISCGKLDQFCEVLSRKSEMLYLDTQDDSYETIPVNPNMGDYKIAIFFSGVERSLIKSKYNVRVDECKSAAYALKAFAGLEYETIDKTVLRDVPCEVYQQYKDRLPDAWRKRAEHFYTEYQRVEEGRKAWEKGDIECFGKLCFESGRSSIDNYETGSAELKALFEIMLTTDGIYGGRFSGAGFKGCCMAFINPVFEEKIKQSVTQRYIQEFPLLTDKFSVHICESADGVKL